MKVSIGGGTPTAIVDGGGNLLNEPTWLSDGTIVFGQIDGLWRAAGVGSKPVQLAKTDSPVIAIAALPGSRAVCFNVASGGAEPSIELLVLASQERREVVRGRDPVFLPTGHLLFARNDGSLSATRLDADRLAAAGEPTSLSTTAFRQNSISPLQLSAAASGSLVYLPGNREVAIAGRLAWVGRDGASTPIVEKPGVYEYPRLSPVADSSLMATTTTFGRWISCAAAPMKLTLGDRMSPGRPPPSPIVA